MNSDRFTPARLLVMTITLSKGLGAPLSSIDPRQFEGGLPFTLVRTCLDASRTLHRWSESGASLHQWV